MAGRREWRSGLRAGVLAGALAWPMGLRAQDAPLPLTRLNGEITLDGRPDEAAWQTVEPLPLTLFLPVLGGTPTQRTEIRVAYDDDHLYVAGRFYDTDPDGIRINSLYRDRWNGDDALASPASTRSGCSGRRRRAAAAGSSRSSSARTSAHRSALAVKPTT